MKNRDRQRMNRKVKEEMLNLNDLYGVADPTPYEAVRELIKELRRSSERRSKHGVCTNIEGI